MTRRSLAGTVASALLLTAVPSLKAATGPPAVGSIGARTGAALYAANCSTCHGSVGQGVRRPAHQGVGDLDGEGPPLTHVGALAADFYLRTGYMPLASPGDEPSRSPVQFSDAEIGKLVAFVAALGNGPAKPHPQPARGSLADGFREFSDHCAACHQIAAQGGYVTGAHVPPLGRATDVQIAEAVRVGPYVMPRFSTKAISNAELDSLVRYVDYTRHPNDPGGWSLGRVGPVPEGLVAWLLSGAVLVAVCVTLSRRVRRA